MVSVWRSSPEFTASASNAALSDSLCKEAAYG